jgi:putative transposase
LLRRRIEYEGAFYHVIQRGNNREHIFRKEIDKQSYLSKLVDLKKQLSFKLFGYVLMDNHYHLLLQTGKDPLHKIIFRQNMFYSRYFNNKYQRSGHLYGDRYKASLIQDERYLFAVLRYIHWNPVKAGLVKSPDEFAWSSDRAYRSNNNKEVDIDFILNILSPNRQAALAAYGKQMAPSNDDFAFEAQKFIGDPDFVESIQSENKHQEIASARLSLDELLKNTGVSNADYALIRKGSRKRYLRTYKELYMKNAREQGYSYREIGEHIKLSDSAVGLYLSE